MASADRRSRPRSRPSRAGRSPGDWLSLTELGRRYGISAVHTGRLLASAGLRLPGGEPSPVAVAEGLAQRQPAGHHHQALWSAEGCGPHLERQGLVPLKQPSLVGLWADLLTALQQGSPSISVSAEEMAGDVPSHLVSPLNRELRQRGSSFRVRLPLRKAAAPRPACLPSPASGAAVPHPCD